MSLTPGPAVRRSAWPVRVFAVDDRSAQVTWRASPAAGLQLEIGDVVARPVPSPPVELHRSLIFTLGLPSADDAERDDHHRLRHLATGAGLLGRRSLDPHWPGGPGAVVAEGLAPSTTYDVVASAEGVPRFLAARLRTLTPPEGRLLAQFGTVSDVHVGEKNFGVLGRIHDDGEGGPYPERALRAAMDEAAAWGAQFIVAKGDLTRFSVAAEARDAGRILASGPVPVETVLGNHDNQLGVDMRAVLARQGAAVRWQPQVCDIPGLRLVLVHTAHSDPRHHGGQLPADISRQVAVLAGEAAEAQMGVWVGLHHPPEMHWYPMVYPPGIPFAESRALLGSLAAAQPATFVTCGHRHRHRRYAYGPITITEVGSTKDYPGVWAGYRVFEGGLLQTVRRTARPNVLAWTEATRRAMNGQWGRWSPGRLSDRCFSVNWPGARRGS